MIGLSDVPDLPMTFLEIVPWTFEDSVFFFFFSPEYTFHKIIVQFNYYISLWSTSLLRVFTLTHIEFLFGDFLKFFFLASTFTHNPSPFKGVPPAPIH